MVACINVFVEHQVRNHRDSSSLVHLKPPNSLSLTHSVIAHHLCHVQMTKHHIMLACIKIKHPHTNSVATPPPVVTMGVIGTRGNSIR